jgi:Protein of unknown function (DUF4435)
MTTVRYPPRAAQAIGFLKAHSNDIDIFVEDYAAPSLWLKLIRRYLPTGIKIGSVTPLGGRKEVLDACRLDQASGGRKRLYIIDADMDLLTGKPKPRLKRLYRLKRYCVENYLVSQGAVIEAVMSLSPRLTPAAAASSIDLSTWLSSNETNLRSLFTAYAALEHLSVGVATVSYSCHRLFVDTMEYNFCRSRITSRVVSLYRAARAAVGQQRLRETYDLVFANTRKYPAIYALVRRSAGVNAGLEVFRTMLADHADPSVDPYLKRRLASL